MRTPRVAFFPDSFHEVNGVAHTSRNFTDYARRRGLPFLCVRAGAAAPQQTGELSTLELPRSNAAIRMEKDLQFDPLFFRHAPRIERALREFRPDLIHITGPSELGIFGAYFAWRLGLPLAASWHTNLHEYAGRRTQWITRHLPTELGSRFEQTVQTASLEAATRFYRLAQVLYAPNPELCALLEVKTGRPCHLMQRGVETELFSPAKRDRSDNTFVLGYVGRLSIEKNVALLPRIEGQLLARGITDVRFLIVGHGSEEARLRAQLRSAEFAGVLRGEELARAYANMDLLVFPSHTDTFGNVVLEALSSGVPAVVTPHGGPRHIVQHGVTGLIAPFRGDALLREDEAFAGAIADLIRDPELRHRMSFAARAHALGCSWDAVFDKVYRAYERPGTRRMAETVTAQ
ncbi:MAG: glycosyltransferase family 1 protein [Acidobacteriaceae bacterium]